MTDQTTEAKCRSCDGVGAILGYGQGWPEPEICHACGGDGIDRTPAEPVHPTTKSYDELQWRMLRHFANNEADAMEVEAMAWAFSEIERLRAENESLRARFARNNMELLATCDRLVGFAQFVADHSNDPGVRAEAIKQGAKG